MPDTAPPAAGFAFHPPVLEGDRLGDERFCTERHFGKDTWLFFSLFFQQLYRYFLISLSFFLLANSSWKHIGDGVGQSQLLPVLTSQWCPLLLQHLPAPMEKKMTPNRTLTPCPPSTIPLPRGSRRSHENSINLLDVLTPDPCEIQKCYTLLHPFMHWNGVKNRNKNRDLRGF